MYPGQAGVRLTAVPFYAQDAYQCGPAALAGVLGAAGVHIAPSSLAPQVFLPGRRGSLQLELLAASRRAGRIPYVISDTPQALFAQLQAGRPVLVLQNLQTRSFPVWHYAVLVGFDTQTNRVLLNSGAEQGLAMSAPAFLRTWDWAGRWAMVALRPAEIPAGAAPSQYFEALVAFEAVAGGAASAPAWRSAMQRWPQDGRPYLALGNMEYARGALAQAADYYQRGLVVSPNDPALGNNLASVLGEAGCPRQGRQLLEPVLAALPAASPWRAEIQSTLAELALQPSLTGASCATLW